MYLNDVFTVTVNMAGLPGIAVPAGLSGNGLPLALQLIGRPFDEETLFSLASAIEQAAPKIELPEPWWRDSDERGRDDIRLAPKTSANFAARRNGRCPQGHRRAR